ncbi:MAG: SDR family oxidoreductase [Candidatus Omnitrophica bacterium]|nr:SDR family oxidoreductase [Candidatus Omnitrophota bacterium]
MRSIGQLTDLSGRRALVTGAAGKIGSMVSQTLSEMGAKVVLLDLEPEACRKSAELVSQQGNGKGIALTCNLEEEKATRRTIREAVQALGGLEILVHCAAYVGTTPTPGWAVPFEQQSVAAWEAALRVNLTSAFVMVQEAKEALVSSGHGSVIFFSSIYGLMGPDFRLYEGTSMNNPAAYGASKGGLLQLTRYLATLLAPKVRVNAITPGGVWRDQPDSFHQQYVSRTPLGRMATEEDLKGAVLYLASDLSAYVTGQNLVVDGGWTAW